MEAIGPIDLPKSVRIALKLSQIFFQFVSKGGYNLSHSLLRSLYYSIVIRHKFKITEFDLIFAPAASSEIAFLKTEIPIYYLSDSSFDQMIGYYSYFSNLNKVSIYEGSMIERRALSKSKQVVHSSRWASDFVIQTYKINPDQAKVFPFGANIDCAPSLEQVTLKLTSKSSCNLVFIGLNWLEKGGNIAYDTFVECNKLGLNTTLTICGCIPPSDVTSHTGVEVFPFLNKNIASDYEDFISILKRSHFLLLPTRFECTAIVLSEAGAFGLPSLTTETGGLGCVIENGINGFRFDLNDSGDLYAKYIIDMFSDKDKYKQLVLSTRSVFDEKLNWESWGNSMRDLILSDFNTKSC